MTRDLSAFERNLVDAMAGHAHDAEPPRFDASGIIDTERRRARRRVGLVAVSSVTAAVVAACVATSPAGSGRTGPPVVPVTGVSGTTAPPSSASPSPGSATPRSTAASPTTSAGASTPSKAAIPVWPTTSTSSPFQGSVPPVPLLTSIRAAGHPEDGYDRISFEFTGQLPGYSAGYVGQAVLDGSGAAVRLPGTAFLRLTFRSGQAHDANGAPTVTAVAGTPITVGQSELEAYALTGDFEGSVSVVLGLSAPHGFRVGVLTKSATDHVIYVDVARS